MYATIIKFVKKEDPDSMIERFLPTALDRVPIQKLRNVGAVILTCTLALGGKDSGCSSDNKQDQAPGVTTTADTPLDQCEKYKEDLNQRAYEKSGCDI